MDETDYQNILSAIKKLEKEVDKLEKRVMRHQMMLSVPQASTEEEKIKIMLELDTKELNETKRRLTGVKWLLE